MFYFRSGTFKAPRGIIYDAIYPTFELENVIDRINHGLLRSFRSSFPSGVHDLSHRSRFQIKFLFAPDR